MRKSDKLYLLKFIIIFSSPVWIILIAQSTLEAFDKDTWKKRHINLELLLYDCKALYTGYSFRGDGTPPLKGDRIHSKSECKKFREEINKFHKKLYNEEYPYDWKLDGIEDWDEFRREGEVKTQSSER
ncbi:hypothetical protein [Bacillus mycoides]|uniref:hypothetical protein n=1 Tax=Bacillus mycoides TaxID=1405 RepID=UPI0020791ABB|nr:hypothetical protein [Bacillus mycoides]